jgi:phosphatidylglycerophosphate synthase
MALMLQKKQPVAKIALRTEPVKSGLTRLPWISGAFCRKFAGSPVCPRFSVAPRRVKRYVDFMATQPFRDAERQQLSMLAAVEKKTLIWLAHRMPGWVNSDHLTLLGFVAMFAAGLCYWAARWDRRALIGVILALAVNWFGDSLDGTLARVRNRLRPRYGFYVDHVTDAIGTFFLIGGLGLSGYMSLDIALGLLIAYFLLSIEVYLTTYTIGTFHLSFWSFGPTELRLLLCIGNIALFYRPQVVLLGHKLLLFDIGGAVGIAGMALMLLWAAVRHTRQLYQAERLP